MNSIFKNHPTVLAVATLVGMIIGAGTFGIPYAMAKAGFLVGFFYLLVLGLAVMLIHLHFGEIILRTKEPCRWVGCAGMYLGPWAKRVVTFNVFFQYYGSMLAYIILGGEFLKIILGRFWAAPEYFWPLVFFLTVAVMIWWGIKSMGWGEFFMIILMFLAIAFLFIKGTPLISFDNFNAGNLKDFFLPYGVIFFALTGAAAIPEMRQILKGRERYMKKAIILGTLIPVIFYVLFAFLVVGITGPFTSEDALGGLVPHLGGTAILVGSFFGILAILSSYLVLGINLQETLTIDYGVKKNWAFVLVMAVPLILYLAGFHSFILVIGIIGALASGLDGILTVLVYRKARKKGDRQPEYSLAGYKAIGFFLIAIFALGIIYQLVYISGK